MRVRAVSIAFCLWFTVVLAFGQVGNGKITGIVTDQAGAVVGGAKVEVKNSETGIVYRGASTVSGNYTIADLPVGTYSVTVSVTGFKTYTHSDLAVQAAGVVRENARLEVGSSGESVVVTAEASLLNVDSGELAHNVTVGDMDQLPLLGIGTVNAGAAGYRNPYNTLLTLPGVSNYYTSGTFQVNGLGNAFSTTETMRVEGQDATVRFYSDYDYTQFGQPGADAVQEIAYQMSNYAPEFGQAGSVVINMTMKGGSNQYHGSGFDYFVNEDLNAGDPFSISGGPGSRTGGDLGKFRPRNRRNDFGGTIGGPVYLPKIYDGHNKTFFFWSYEEYLETTLLSFTDTVPYAPFRQGDFSSVSPNGNCSLCPQYGIQMTPLTSGPDPLGSPQFANEIYDPLTRVIVNGSGYAYPFQKNSISPTRFDRVSQIFQAEFPLPSSPSLLSRNYNGSVPSNRYSAIPSIKIDHNLSARDKLSFYYSENNTQSQISTPLGNADGLPLDIGEYRGNFVSSWIYRLNYDHTLTPTLLLHMGIGYQRTRFDDHAPVLNYNPEQAIGIGGFLLNRNIPALAGMVTGNYGGMQNVGPSGQSTQYEGKPSATASLTWVKGQHTFKFGGEAYVTGDIMKPHPVVTFTASAAGNSNATMEPFTPGSTSGVSNSGFAYADFLLGDYNNISQSAPAEPHVGYQTWDWYAQDSWKITRRLTVDYGLRYDLNTAEKETYNRWAQFAPNVINTNAGGHPGGITFANDPAGSFQYQPVYPWALGPRIGIAYQIDPKTVVRAGWGFAYQFVGSAAGGTVSISGQNVPAGINSFVNIEGPGAVPQPVWPIQVNTVNCGPGCTGASSIYPNFGTTAGSPMMPDRNQNRPPRIDQYSVGLQRELTRNLVVEASYVGNHAVWIGGPLGFLSETSAQDYASYGLFPFPGTGPCAANALTVCSSNSYPNDNDRMLLTQPVGNPQAIQHELAAGMPNGGYLLPYTSAPASTSLLTAIKPYPQFPNLDPSPSPTGDSLYNSLQTKLTKRFAHSLQAGGSFTWAKSFTRAARSDFFNPNIQVWNLQNIPFRTLNFNAIYIVPKASFLNKWENQLTRDWQIGFFANYQTGSLLNPPTNYLTSEFLNGEESRVPGAPLYAAGVDINNHQTFSPYFTQVLNPAAWQKCPVNTVCTAGSPSDATLYPDFRGPRQPTENANIGRNFRIKERMNLQIRGEFVNIFNRTIMPNPSTLFPQTPPVQGGMAGGARVYTSGFGIMNAYAAPSTAPPVSPGNAPLTSAYNVLAPRTGTIIARFTF